MNPSSPQPAPIIPEPPHLAAIAPASAAPASWQRDRITRINDLTPEDATAGLLWLAVNDPAICDAVLDKLEDDAIDDPDPAREPAPYCVQCGADIGIFLRDGQHWQHYTGDGTIARFEVFDPGHDPVVAWRVTSVPATR